LLSLDQKSKVIFGPSSFLSIFQNSAQYVIIETTERSVSND